MSVKPFYPWQTAIAVCVHVVSVLFASKGTGHIQIQSDKCDLAEGDTLADTICGTSAATVTASLQLRYGAKKQHVDCLNYLV